MQVHPFIHEELAHQQEAGVRRGSRAATQAPAALSPIVDAARSGDPSAWEALVERFTPLLRHVVGGYRLSSADTEDVIQTAWVSAFSNIAGLREVEAVGGWLCVIARREASRALTRRRREVPVGEAGILDRPDHATPETALIEAEYGRAVHAAIGRLNDRQRTLLVALLRDQGTSYADVAEKLGLPIGSIGPTRDRALARLRRDRELVAIR
jgi:RNA polymerase sigma factor (sigma-70 family)